VIKLIFTDMVLGLSQETDEQELQKQRKAF
jgi:hypothetical protein